MSAGLQHVRIRLPRPLFDKLATQAKAAKTDVAALVVQAVAADLAPAVSPAGRARTSRKTAR